MAAKFGRALQWVRGLEGLRRQTFWTAVALAALLLGFVLYFRSAEKPWKGKAGIYKRSYDKGNRKNLPTAYFVQVYEWKAAAINIGLCAALLLTCPFWMRWAASKPEAPKNIDAPKERMFSRGGLLMLLAALVLATALRAPRLDAPIYLDEQDNLRRSVHGYYDERGEQTVWKGSTWQDSFFENRLANNPIFHSVLARACVDSWRAVSGADADQFNIVALRIPAFIAGLVAIGMLWGLLRWLGYPAAAAFSAFLFAVHPEAINYGTQARGYTLMMVFAIAAVWLALKAIGSCRWRDWALFAVAQFLCIYSYTGSVYLPMALNATLSTWFAFGWLRGKSQRSRAQLVKLCVVAAFTAIVTLQAMLPALVQAKIFLAEKWYHTELRAEWVFDAWNHFTTGTDLPATEEWWDKYPHDERPNITSYIFGEFLHDEFSLFLLDFLVEPALLIFGLVFVWKRSRAAGAVALAGILAPLLAFGHHRFITGLWIHTWYLIYFLPIFIMLVSVGITDLPRRIRAIPRARVTAITAVVCAAFLFWFELVTSVKTGKGRLRWKGLEWTSAVSFPRGGSVWLVTPDGRMFVRDKPE